MTATNAALSLLILCSFSDVEIAMVPALQTTMKRLSGPLLSWTVCLLVVSCGAQTLDAAPNDIAGLELIATRWGFDGTVPVPSFAPVSLQVRNHSKQPWEGIFRLKPTAGDDATTAMPVNVPPETVKWVQLIPYIPTSQAKWNVSWGTLPAETLEIDGPNTGGAVAIQLTPGNEATTAGGPVRHFPAELFPRSVAPMNGLSLLVLDFVPDWDAQQSQVFLDWLHAGGLALLSQAASQNYPVFAGELQSLNGTAEKSHHGAGTLIRVPLSRSDDRWQATVTRIVNNHFRSKDITSEQGPMRRERAFQHPTQLGDRPIFEKLLQRVRFNRNWLLVNLSVIAYLLVLFPLCYRIGHVRKNVRWFYLVFGGAVCLFSFVFWMIGQLGASERNRIASAAVAESVSHQRLMVTQWSQLAAVSQLETTLAHTGEGLWYGTGDFFDRARGTLQGAVQPHADLKFPPASTRTLLHRETLSHRRPAPSISLINLDEAALRDVQFAIDGCFESPPLLAYAMYRGRFYPLEFKDQHLQQKRNATPVSDVEFLVESAWFQPRNPTLANDKRDKEPVSFENRELLQLLLAHQFGVTDANRGRISIPDEGHFTLAVLTEMPKTFFAQTDDFHQQSGVVLWVYDLPLEKSF